MKLGINMLLWTTDACGDEFLPLFETIKGIGYDGVELPVFSTDVKAFKKLGARLDAIGLERTAVTVRSSADDPMSSDAEVRAAGVAANKAVLDCCQAVGATHLVGPYHSALGQFSGKAATPDEWNWAVSSMRQVAEHAEPRGVTLALEYLNRFECYLLNCAEDTVRFLQDVDHPSCRMMYDSFHAHIEEKSAAEAIRTGGKNIAHVHISESDRSTPGTGQVHWRETFEALQEINYDGWLMVEAFGLALPALAAATKIWRPMYASEDQLLRDAYHFMRSNYELRITNAGVPAGRRNG